MRRGMGFAWAWGFRRVVIVNMYALRATDPADLISAADDGTDPVGSINDACIREHVRRAELVVAGWGTHGSRARAETIAEIVAESGRRLTCLGRNADGSPRHPLYLSAGTALEPWPGPPVSGLRWRRWPHQVARARTGRV